MHCVQCGTQNPETARFCFHCGHALLNAESVPSVAPDVQTVEYAGFWRRWIAYIIDKLILGLPTAAIVVFFVIPSVLAVIHGCCNPEYAIQSVLSVVIGWLWLIVLIMGLHLFYFAWFESSRFQATPGKMALGIIVTDMQGNPISFPRAVGRNLGKGISHLVYNIGYIMAGITARKQALHDMLADCVVVMRVKK